MKGLINVILNKAIFYCEILGCKRILLNRNFYWFIKNKIIYKKFKMSIELIDEKNIKMSKMIIDQSRFFFIYFKFIFPHYRSKIIKKEILNINISIFN